MEQRSIIVGRNNAPAFSRRWLSDNSFHVRTLNPFDATALGMSAIAHGNDCGGSIRYPAWACGVVGQCTMVALARLASQVMARGTRLDPPWAPAPLRFPDADQPSRVAVFRSRGHSPVHTSVTAADERATGWLADAGYTVEEAKSPHFAQVCAMQFEMVMNGMRRAGAPLMREHGDHALRQALDQALSHYMAVTPEWDRDQYLEALARRFIITRDWAMFFERYPVLLMPNYWERQFPINNDLASPERTAQILMAQAPC